ncbi:hypothetical protein A8709_11320 [Paenibacillus pectinilyticus]|uniref:Uncharacterized protein n=1 Tax=Paenibacillus pectinilyticus TaxID=512399 RepID=A0A1C1A2K2_9BACL|nr:hypothetical protein [Paenibacillus pectinilyticus]OCT14759.1 hypothetical protein A8709_11320 [Paenibacillus pectinilyticus]
MRFCLYDIKYDRVILVAKNFASALEQKEKFGIFNDVSVFPLLSKKEYMLVPHSYRGNVSGRHYLLYEIPGVIEQRYDQVIVQEEKDDMDFENGS